MPRRRRNWMTLGLDAWMLGAESASVITLRTMRIAAGGAQAGPEIDRMVREKVVAAAQIQAQMLTGALGGEPTAATAAVLRHYRRKVGANRRRLLKG